VRADAEGHGPCPRLNIGPITFGSFEEVSQALRDSPYLADRGLSTAVFLAGRMRRPLLFEVRPEAVTPACSGPARSGERGRRRTLRRSSGLAASRCSRAGATVAAGAGGSMLLLDISGSMADHARGLLTFAHAALHSSPHCEAFCEAFCFGTRVRG
jgi:hypothetical protein